MKTMSVIIATNSLKRNCHLFFKYVYLNYNSNKNLVFLTYTNKDMVILIVKEVLNFGCP
jgi:hypothetical protein